MTDLHDSDRRHRGCRYSKLLAILLTIAWATAPGAAQSKQSASKGAQALDEEYTKKIKEYTQDPRISTELVDHLPASTTVPTPLKFLGHMPGTPGELTYAKDIHRYYEAIDKASDRISMWTIGKSEEGRDIVVLAVADEATIKQLPKYKESLAALTDPRKTTQEQATQLMKTAKPIYWITSGMHSGETGGPEMLLELAYRLAVEETPFIQNIRNNVITFITPVIEVDGREKHVDTYYYGKKTGKPRPPLMYWGQYVAHDNNRDAMGLALKLTQAVMTTFLEWRPTVLHDLHEAQTYLYASTGTGPYNTSLVPLLIDEWWMLAMYEVAEMTKRGVPGVWTYGFYDGWVPNYMFFIANTHNAIGRFYEVASYGPEPRQLVAGANVTSREWFRPNPPLANIQWGPRNNTNIQQSAILFALSHVAKNKDMYLENYYAKNKAAIERGKTQGPHAWVIPAGQRAKVNTADLVNLLRRQGAEIHTANAAFTSGAVEVAAGDYIIRMDQPYSTVVDTLLDTQVYPAANPRPYDDTGWTLPPLRNVKAVKATDKSILEKAMTLMTADATVPGTIAGSGSTLIIDHTTDNSLMTFRFANKDVKMQAAEEDFDAAGRKFTSGAFIVPNADRAKLEPSIKAFGLSAFAVASAPTVKAHDLDVPRIGYVHSWANTQNEGWVRIAFDHYKVPYTYFADQKLREGNLRAKYDVIVFPHVGGNAVSQVNGIPMTGTDPIPYKKSDITPNLGVQDSSDDIRGGMGIEGLAHLQKFVEEGGMLLVEGSTTLIPIYFGWTPGVTVEEPEGLFVRGSVMKALIADRKSPIAYGYDQAALGIYFNQAPVLNAGGGGGGFGGFGGGRGGDVGQNITPNAGTPLRLTTLDAPPRAAAGPAEGGGRGGRGGRGGAGEGGGAGFGRGGGGAAGPSARVVVRFPTDPNDMLLSGSLVGGDSLAGRAVVVDAPLGKGHVVMFANRPYWRWQTHGNFFLGFNAILNWNDLDAGKAAARPAGTGSVQER